MTFVPRMARAVRDPETLVLTTTSDAAVQGNFTTFTGDDIRDVLIQNDTANKAYVIWGTEAVAATTNHTILPASGNISLEMANYTYFSVIRVPAGSDVTVHITGIG